MCLSSSSSTMAGKSAMTASSEASPRSLSRAARSPAHAASSEPTPSCDVDELSASSSPTVCIAITTSAAAASVAATLTPAKPPSLAHHDSSTLFTRATTSANDAPAATASTSQPSGKPAGSTCPTVENGLPREMPAGTECASGVNSVIALWTLAWYAGMLATSYCDRKCFTLSAYAIRHASRTSSNASAASALPQFRMAACWASSSVSHMSTAASARSRSVATNCKPSGVDAASITCCAASASTGSTRSSGSSSSLLAAPPSAPPPPPAAGDSTRARRTAASFTAKSGAMRVAALASATCSLAEAALCMSCSADSRAMTVSMLLCSSCCTSSMLEFSSVARTNLLANSAACTVVASRVARSSASSRSFSLADDFNASSLESATANFSSASSTCSADVFVCSTRASADVLNTFNAPSEVIGRQLKQ